MGPNYTWKQKWHLWVVLRVTGKTLCLRINFGHAFSSAWSHTTTLGNERVKFIFTYKYPCTLQYAIKISLWVDLTCPLLELRTRPGSIGIFDVKPRRQAGTRLSSLDHWMIWRDHRSPRDKTYYISYFYLRLINFLVTLFWISTIDPFLLSSTHLLSPTESALEEHFIIWPLNECQAAC